MHHSIAFFFLISSCQKHRATSQDSSRRTRFCCTPLLCPPTRSARSLTWGRCWPDTTHRGPAGGTGKTAGKKVPPHTHTHTHAVRWGKVRSQFAEVYPKLLLFLGGVPLSRQERALGRENAFRFVSLRDLPSVLLTGGGMVEEGWCVGIKMAGGEVFVRAETPPPCLWNPNNGERRGSGVWRGAHGAQRGARVPVAPTTKRFLYDFIRSSIFEGTWHETYF